MPLADNDDRLRILIQPGRLVVNPTNFSLAFPYGGTSLGMTESGVLLNSLQNYEIITTEEGGITPQEIISLGEQMYVQAELTEFDDAVIDQVWNGKTITGTDRKNIAWPGDGTIYPGKALSGQAVKLLFVPEDLDRNTVMYCLKAVPVKPSQDMHFKASEKTIYLAQFLLMEDTTLTSSPKDEYRGLFIGDFDDLTV